MANSKFLERRRPPCTERQVYLPTEIIVQIVSFVAAEPEPRRRQSTLHACCLISRQWYSAAISFLYERPRVGSGISFKRFTDTVCPPIRARKSKLNLGSFVLRLDLSVLVHHSSNSLTARLLGRVKEHLEVFVAPKVSFSINSLPALSKCLNLRFLDLSLVGEPIPFLSLEKSLSHLQKLITLRLPRHTCLTSTDTVPTTTTTIRWPPRLQRLQISGTFSPLTISPFPFPPHLTSLTLKNCDNLSVTSLAALLSNPHLGASLERLTISHLNRNLDPGFSNAVLAFLPELTFLSVPGDLLEDVFFDIIAYMTTPLSLRVLELGHPYTEPRLGFSTQSLIAALGGGLARLRSVGFADVFVTEQRIVEDEEIDRILQKRAASLRDDSGGDVDVDVDVDVGVYYL